ncbi:MAG: thioredoxin domain-containing protein [Polyangiaceae bacterium]
MSEQAVIELNDSNFDDVVKNAKVPVLVDFTATWCGPCKAIGKIVEQIAVEGAGRILVAKVDIEDSPKVAARFGVRAVPTVVVFRGGSPVGHRLGLSTKAKLLELAAT